MNKEEREGGSSSGDVIVVLDHGCCKHDGADMTVGKRSTPPFFLELIGSC